MTLIERVNERIEHDLTSGEITDLIAEATNEINARYGPPGALVTRILDGHRRRLDFPDPIDATEPVTITETASRWSPATPVTETEYVIRNGGRTLERVARTSLRGEWGSTVTVIYTPISNQAQREEVTIGLVQLAIDRLGVEQLDVGDMKTRRVDYVAERERLLGSLAPRRGMLLA